MLAALFVAAPAAASPVLTLHDGHVTKREVRFAGPTELPAPPSAVAARAKRTAAPKGRPTRDALDRLRAGGEIDQATYDSSTASMKRALRAYRRLTGTRKAELAAVIANADSIAASGRLVPARLAALSATLER